MSKKARIEKLADSQIFGDALETEDGSFVLVVGNVNSLETHADQSGAEAAERFSDGFETFPYHLHFRAFNADAEYAWYGTQGLRVTVGDEGDLDVVEGQRELTLRERKENGERPEWNAGVAYVLKDGRRVYEKLVELTESVEGEEE